MSHKTLFHLSLGLASVVLLAIAFRGYSNERNRAEAYKAQINAICESGEKISHQFHRENRAYPPITIGCTGAPDFSDSKEVNVVWEQYEEKTYGFTVSLGGLVKPYSYQVPLLPIPRQR